MSCTLAIRPVPMTPMLIRLDGAFSPFSIEDGTYRGDAKDDVAARPAPATNEVLRNDLREIGSIVLCGYLDRRNCPYFKNTEKKADMFTFMNQKL